MGKKTEDDYSKFKPPVSTCKHCGKLMNITDFSLETLKTRGPFKATYLYKCSCSPTDVQVLHVDQYPKIGDKLW